MVVVGSAAVVAGSVVVVVSSVDGGDATAGPTTATANTVVKATTAAQTSGGTVLLSVVWVFSFTLSPRSNWCCRQWLRDAVAEQLRSGSRSVLAVNRPLLDRTTGGAIR